MFFLQKRTENISYSSTSALISPIFRLLSKEKVSLCVSRYSIVYSALRYSSFFSLAELFMEAS